MLCISCIWDDSILHHHPLKVNIFFDEKAQKRGKKLKEILMRFPLSIFARLLYNENMKSHGERTFIYDKYSYL